ncbi:MAG: 2-C-methyl-D-erythritol 4-phosphate cytidylyltransferase [Nitrospirae bacterium]|nr:2-C-methyl-D-erythritol 4-phosphate cytidylyltransferase [Nitrospirota bacterium]MCL5284932.1 2-C-methyl-D-erythritol 4-phosphate cytidylyltransferase [Nitrospirota bacterium]
MSVGIVLAAGGRGVRMGGALPKQFIEIGGTPIYLQALRPFLEHPKVSAIRIGMPEDYAAEVGKFLMDLFPGDVFSGRLAVFPGGRRRQDTVEKGVRLISGVSGISGVLVHDAARPFLSPEILDRTIRSMEGGKAVGVGVPVSDTLWRVSGEEKDVEVREIVARESIVAAQTPQGAPLALFLAALDRAQQEDREFTDEASLFLWAGIPFVLVEGSNRNRKITRPEDLSL